MYSCDYNGWADVPEEEREGIDAFEATQTPTGSGTGARLVELVAAEFHVSGQPLDLALPRRKAA